MWERRYKRANQWKAVESVRALMSLRWAVSQRGVDAVASVISGMLRLQRLCVARARAQRVVRGGGLHSPLRAVCASAKCAGRARCCGPGVARRWRPSGRPRLRRRGCGRASRAVSPYLLFALLGPLQSSLSRERAEFAEALEASEQRAEELQTESLALQARGVTPSHVCVSSARRGGGARAVGAQCCSQASGGPERAAARAHCA